MFPCVLCSAVGFGEQRHSSREAKSKRGEPLSIPLANRKSVVLFLRRMKQDAMSLQDVPDEPTTLADDLLEDSNCVFHHDMAKFQLEQQERLHTVMLATND